MSVCVQCRILLSVIVAVSMIMMKTETRMRMAHGMIGDDEDDDYLLEVSTYTMYSAYDKE